MSNASEIYDKFTSKLGFKDSEGFKELGGEQDLTDVGRGKSKLGIDAIYKSPSSELEESTLIYFKKFAPHSESTIEKVYNNVWNEGKASLLIFILPDEIRVYNPSAKPILSVDESIDDQEERLIETLRLGNTALEEVHGVEQYDRKYIDSREYWRRKDRKFQENYRVDDYLHDDLTSLKSKLESDLNLDPSHTNQIIIKSIFVKFLEAREIISDEKREKWGIEASYNKLLPEKDEVYRLFDLIKEEYNGDVFGYNEEEHQAIQKKHLDWVRRFLEGEDVETGQRRLFPYQFDIIPIELISSIYEDFVSSTKGVYYTPSYLVEHVMNDYVGESFNTESKILDPACGSGVFLVVAFEKILQELKKDRDSLNREDILDIARENLVGVDKSREAIRITAFSLSLKVFEHLEKNSIGEPLQLPDLIGESIFESDFFEEREFEGEKYDLIVGNPPWVRRKNSKAMSFCDKNDLPSGNNQIALGFMWKSLELLKEDGKACLLVPTRDVLLNARTEKFRGEFFKEASLESVLNLSILREGLFSASSPCSVVKFSKNSRESDKVQYITPSHQNADATQSIIVDPDDVKYISQTEKDARFWKCAMYGDTTDFEILRGLSDTNTIEEFVEEYDLVTGEGFQFGGPKNYQNKEIRTIPHLSPRDHQPHWIDKEDFVEFDETEFHRPRSGTKIWEGPRLLIKEGVPISKRQKFRSAYVESPVTFKHGIMAIRGGTENSDYLKCLDLFLNSTFAQYYFFMTSTKWGVERAEVEKNEIMQFPFPYTEITESHNQLIDLHDRITEAVREGDDGAYESAKQQVDKAIYKILGISEREQLVIESRVSNTIDYYHNGRDAHAESPPNVEDLKEYVEIISDGLSEFLGGSEYDVSGKCYRQEDGLYQFSSNESGAHYSPLNLATFYLDSDSKLKVKEASNELTSAVNELSDQAVGAGEGNIYFQRNSILYHSSEVHVIKPNRRRFWDPAAAVNDINWILGGLIEKGGEL